MKCPLVLLAAASLTLSLPALAQQQDRIDPHAGGGAGKVTTPPAVPESVVLTGYTDHTTWKAAVGSTTLITFESIADGTEINSELASFGISNVTGTSDFEVPPGPTTQWVTSSASLPFPMFIAGTLPSEPNFISNTLVFPGPAATGTMTFEFSSAHFAVGGFIADQTGLGDDILELFDASGASLGSVIIPGGGVLPNSFLGVTSDTEFWFAKFYSASGTDSWGLDDLEFDDGTIGTNYCIGAVNSVGPGATILASGSASVAANNLTLMSSPVPNDIGLFFVGPSQQQVPFGNGFLCVVTPIVRINPPASASGNMASRQVDLPTFGIVAGSHSFQYWYRDPAAMGAFFNLSDGVTILFTP